MSPRQVVTEVEVDHRPVRPASNVSHMQYEERRESVHNFGDLVMRIVRNQRKSKPLPGKWMPHSQPVRKINTSTK